MKELRSQALLKLLLHFQCSSIDLHAQIRVRLFNNEIVETTVGRVLVYEAFPEGFEFQLD